MRPVFIGGCGRSGTTLLGAMLGTQDQCLTTPEAKFTFIGYKSGIRNDGQVDIWAAINTIKAHWSFKVFDIDLDAAAISELGSNPSYSELINLIVKTYGHRAGKSTPEVWVDHTPDNIIYATTLFKLFPKAKMIHLVRDGRAVAASVMKLDWGPNTINSAATWWVNRVAHGLVTETSFSSERVRQIKYENLILSPEATLKEICTFLEIEYQAGMVKGTGFKVPEFSSQGHDLVGHTLKVERVKAWQQELAPRQIEIFESIAGNVLCGLGYELLYDLRAREVTRLEHITLGLQELYRRQITNKLHRQHRIRQAVSAEA